MVTGSLPLKVNFDSAELLGSSIFLISVKLIDNARSLDTTGSRTILDLSNDRFRTMPSPNDILPGTCLQTAKQRYHEL
jgi:hypothetical protein